MPEREVDVKKDPNAKGIMKAVVLKVDGDDVQFAIRKGGQAKIHKYFMSFFANRKSHEGRPKPIEDPDLEKMRDVPFITAYSRKIADEARSKLFGGKKGDDIVTLLYEKEVIKA